MPIGIWCAVICTTLAGIGLIVFDIRGYDRLTSLCYVLLLVGFLFVPYNEFISN